MEKLLVMFAKKEVNKKDTMRNTDNSKKQREQMKILLFITTFFLLVINGLSQKNISFEGYVSQMGSSQIFKDSSDAIWDYGLHNRINLAWYLNNKLTFKLELRNQFKWGETMRISQGFANFFEEDKGVIDLNWNWFQRKNALLNTQIDRFYGQFTQGEFELTLGRQRINWGRSLVWNPNDIFNSFSYYDFDYAEKPGADAIKAVRYFGSASSVEMVAKMDSSHHLSVGALSKSNKWGYDFQFMGGYIHNEDFVVGFGWEGSILKFSFRGELSYFQPERNFYDTTGVFLATLGSDISFDNNLMIQAEFLYNDNKSLMPLLQLVSEPNTSKSLSISTYTIFVNATYPITPIFSVYLAGMYYTDQNGFFMMPGLDLSLANNLNASLIYQYFNLKTEENQRIGMNQVFARLKWNF